MESPPHLILELQTTDRENWGVFSNKSQLRSFSFLIQLYLNPNRKPKYLKFFPNVAVHFYLCACVFRGLTSWF